MVMFSGSSTLAQESLSSARLAALEALNEGWNFNDAAAVAGVNRTTLYRWIQKDPEFRLAFTLGQQIARDAARSQLVAGADASVSRVTELMEEDCKFALKVIKELGLLKPAPAGATDAEDARREIEIEAMEREHHLEQRLAKLVSRHGAKRDLAAEANEDSAAGKGEKGGATREHADRTSIASPGKNRCGREGACAAGFH